jgi:hypothetical protein
LQASLEEYRAALDKVDVEFRDDLIRLSREVAVTLQAGYSPEAARGYDRLLDVQDEVIARQARLDDEFFERLTVALDDSQLTYLERAKQLRRREQCFPLYVFVPWAQIDLSEFIESFGLGPDVLAEIDAMLIDYEHRVTPMFVELRESIDRHASAKVWGVVKAKYDSDGKPYAPDSEAAAKYAAEYFQMNDATLARQSSLMKRIGELNESVLAQILPLVDEPQRSAIRETFNSRAYPDVFPDPSDPIEVYRGLANSENLTEADREVLSALWSSYREQYDAKCRLMLESYKSWREQLARNEVHGDAQRYSMEMRRWRMERSELNRVVVGQIQQTLSNQLNQQQVEAIQAYLNRMVKLREYTN